MNSLEFYIAGVVDAKLWLQQTYQYLPRVFCALRVLSNAIETKVFPSLVNYHVEDFLSESSAVFLQFL